MQRYEQFKRDIKGILNNDIEALAIGVGLLIAAGTINILSSTYAEEALSGGAFGVFFKHMIYFSICFAAGVAAMRVDYHKWRKSKYYNTAIYMCTAALIMVYIKGTVVNGARRWLTVGPLSIQPSEFAKLIALVWAAVFLAKQLQSKEPVHLFSNKAPFLAQSIWPALGFAGLTLFQPDLGTAFLIVLFPFLLHFLAGISKKQFFGAIACGIALVIVAIIIEPYRMARFFTFLDPWSKAQDEGYQIIQSLVSVGSGGLWGHPFGTGTSKFFFLPEAHTDFAFAIWAQEWGFIGIVFVLLLLGWIAYYGGRIATRAYDYLGKLLAMGTTLLIVGQALFNILMVFGGMPVVGVPFPFFSYGGSALLVNMVALGFLFNVAYKNHQYEKARGQRQAVLSLREETQSRYVPTNRR